MRCYNGVSADVLRVLLDYSPSASFLRDGMGTYLWVNRAFADLYEVQPGEMPGRNVSEFDPPVLAAMQLESDQSVLTSGLPLRHTLPLPRPDGISEMAGHRFRVRLPNGRAAVAGVYTDVTELCRYQEAVSWYRKRCDALFDRSAVLLAVVDHQGTVRELNRAFAQFVGRPATSLRGHPLQGVLGEHSVREVLTADENTRLSVKICRSDGTTWPAIASAVAEPDGFGMILTLQPLPFTPKNDLGTFSDRESDLLELVAQGLDNITIAGRLHLSRQGLDYHLRRLRRRLHATTRSDLVARAYTAGVLDPSSWPPSVRHHLREASA